MNRLTEKIDQELRRIEKKCEKLVRECEEVGLQIQSRFNSDIDRAIVAEENGEISESQLKDRLAMIEFQYRMEWLIETLPQQYAFKKNEEQLCRLAEEKAELSQL